MSLLNLFPQAARLPSKADAWLHDYQAQALKNLSLQDISLFKKHEDWRYNKLPFTLEAPMSFADGSHPPPADTHALQERLQVLSSDDEYRLVFYNGVFMGDLSSSLPSDQVTVMPMQKAIHLKEDVLKKLLKTFDNHDPFEWLNQAFYKEGACIEVHANTSLEKPIHLIHLCEGLTSQHALTYRHSLITGKKSHAKLIQTYACSTGAPFSNVVTDVFLHDEATLDFMQATLDRSETRQTSFLRAALGEASELRTFSYRRGGQYAMNDIRVLFTKKHAKAFLNGVTLAKDTQVFEQRTRMEHRLGECESMQMFRNILKDASTTNFAGLIIVSKDAQKTNADKLNKNLLLSPHAQANTRPQLIIHADDVKCTHGATIGQLDADELFYLRSRGLSETQCIALLSYAFMNEVIEAIEDSPFKERITKDMKETFF